MHGSLLPKYRGCAPVNWAILSGETQTGVTLHHMVSKADQGDIVDQEVVPISLTNTAGDVTEKLIKAAVTVLERQWDNLSSGKGLSLPQDFSQGSYYRRRTPEDGNIQWQSSALQIHNLIRALLPYPQYPGAWSTLNSHKILILENALPSHALSHHAFMPGTILSAAHQNGDLILHVACGTEGRETISLKKTQFFSLEESIFLQNYLKNPDSLKGVCFV